MVTSVNLSLAMLAGRSGGGVDPSLIARAAARGASGAVFSGGDVSGALLQAERNEARDLVAARNSPEVKRDIARFEKVLAKAKTIDEFLNDPVARKVFMRANGLGDQADYVGLVKKALTADLNDKNSLPYQLGYANRAWIETAVKYNFKLFGVLSLKTEAAKKEIIDAYVGEARLDRLDQTLPGLGTAVMFKKQAASFDSPIKILGSALAREVVTVAFGIPAQIAVQSIKAQEKAVASRMDAKKLAEPAYANSVAQRYLIQINGGNGGIYA